MTVRLSKDLTDKVEAYAAEHGISRSEAIRKLAELGLKDSG